MKIAGCIGFIWLGYIEFKEDKLLTVAFTLFGVVLLNPIYPMDLNLGIQNEIYLLTAIILLIWSISDLFKPPRQQDFLE
jgi:hypothetical protein